MSFEVSKKDNYIYLKITDEKLDGHIAPALKSEITALSEQGNHNMLADLSSCRYCDSSGLSALLVGNRLCKNSGGKFVLMGLQEPVAKLITISQLDTILSVSKSEAEAVSMIK